MKSNKDILTLTDSALDRVRALIEKSDGDVIGLRVGVKTAGCSGMKYNVEYATEIKPFEQATKSYALFSNNEIRSLDRLSILNLL